MSEQNGVNIPPKVLLGLLITGGGVLVSIGGYLAVVKEAPKNISAIAADQKEFKKEARKTHSTQWREISEMKITQGKLETNQKHMMTGIDDIKGMLRRQTRRPRRSDTESGR